MYLGLGQTSVRALEPGGDSLLDVGICHKSLVSQVLCKGSTEMVITESHVNRTCGWLWRYTRQVTDQPLYSQSHARQFVTDANMKQAVTSWLQTRNSDFFYSWIQAMVVRWAKRLNLWRQTTMSVDSVMLRKPITYSHQLRICRIIGGHLNPGSLQSTLSM